MKTDSIFRIASMTKPVTSVAIMMLYEEGKLLLTDPVSRFIPAFKGRDGDGRRWRRGETGRRRGARSPFAICCRTSPASPTDFSTAPPVGEQLSEERRHRRPDVDDDDAGGERSISWRPSRWCSQPGAAFNYSLSTDVLGRVVEVASGQPFNVFLRERIFKPLKMNDTDFIVPEAKWSRFATVYSPDGKGGIRPMNDPEAFGNTAHVAVWRSTRKAEDVFLRRRRPRIDGGRLRALRATCC